MKFSAVALFAAAAGSASALSVTNPSGSSWWVANSVNLLSWSCDASDTLSQYTVIVYGAGSLEVGLPIISLLNNYDCNESIPPNGNLPAGSNYTVALTNPQNRTDIVAISEPFTIEAFGSVYPTSATPTASATISETNTGTTSSSAAPTSTSGAAMPGFVASSGIVSGLAFVLSAFLA